MARPAPRSDRPPAYRKSRAMRAQAVRGTAPVLPSPSSGESETEVMERVYYALATHLIDVTGGQFRRPTKRLGKELLKGLTEIVFRTAIKEGFFRFPAGWGTLRTRPLACYKKRLPSGDIVQLPPARQRLKYEEGSAVRELVGRPLRTKYERQFRRRTILTDRALRVAKFAP